MLAQGRFQKKTEKVRGDSPFSVNAIQQVSPGNTPEERLPVMESESS
jgi:hypothetical protein